MKPLFFHAVAGHAKVAQALASQAKNTLRPFDRFLRQAIHTAKQRQTRYQLPWEPVRNLITFRLEPADTLLRVPRHPPLVVLTDWATDATPALGQQGFVINRSTPFHVEAARATATGLQVRTNVELAPNDRVILCGQQSGVEIQTPPPPADLRQLDGHPLRLRAPARSEDDHWLLLVEGVHEDLELMVDGERMTAETFPSHLELRRVVDQQDRNFDVNDGSIREHEAPADGLLRGDNGVRYRWHEQGSSGRRGYWVQLLMPESSGADEFMDPRAAFCEGDVREVWTQPRASRDTTFKVKKVDQDRYQILLDRYPPTDTTLYLPVDVRNLYLQQRALYQLSAAPLPHHQGLLRLCEDPKYVRWPPVQFTSIRDDDWCSLREPTRDGTYQQRAFVLKALGSPDFAFLEGPPGSGKTTAICELVQQLIEDGQRVLMCASTHVAIDNVLERLLESNSPVDAVRIGKIDKVDDKVQATQLDTRVAALVSNWRGQPTMQDHGDDELEAMAERTVIMSANLTCGTTMGIVNHPLFHGRDEDLKIWERPISTLPHWDVLIIDEASKTLIQEFMVPALMAKRWVIVGDVHQLPPFADRADIVANLRDLVDEDDRALFPPDHQRACLLLFRLLRGRLRQEGMRWLVIEPPGVLEWIARELEAVPVADLQVVRITKTRKTPDSAVRMLSVTQLREGAVDALHLAAADWVLVGNDILSEVIDLLPSNFLLSTDPTATGGANLDPSNVLLARQNWWLTRAGSLPSFYRDRQFRRQDDVASFADCQSCESQWLGRHDLADEIAWRLTRIHELRHGQNRDQREELGRALGKLLPCAVAIDEPIAEIEDIGLPSILEVLQEGIGVERSKRPSSLTSGMQNTRRGEFDARFESLTYQHRMHSQIASFARELIYGGKALCDANTIAIRDATLGWDFGPFRARRVWTHIAGREDKGVNPDEIDAMRALLIKFIEWARSKGPPNRSSPGVWEVACLCFYVKQEGAISSMLRELTQDDRRTRFAVEGVPMEIVCGTVDRFQGREADLVLLSMRNTQRVGFLDSPNRLNVAVTRARQQLVVFGNARYFEDCNISELQELVRRSPVDEPQMRPRGRGR